MYRRPQRDLHSKTTENECTVRIASNLKFGHVEILSYINRAGYMSGHFRLMKQCIKCDGVKALTEYYKSKITKGGYAGTCKSCWPKTTSEVNQKYNSGNKRKIKEYNKIYNACNRKKINLQVNTRYHSDPLFKLRKLVKTRIYHLISHTKHSFRCQEMLGCSLEELKYHLESQFQPWMTWKNWGGHSISTPDTTWDIDHIIPLASACTEEDVYRLSHYTNLQPLCSYHNRFIKRDSL
jgi:hypothetical protein